MGEKGFVPEDVKTAFFRKLRMQHANRTCFECPARGPQWLSITYGVFLCLDCAGQHRLKGAHISFVRGVDLDSFKPVEIVKMSVCGNSKAWEYFKKNGMGKTSESGKQIDYTSSCAQRYKQQIEADMADAAKAHEVHVTVHAGTEGGPADPSAAADTAK